MEGHLLLNRIQFSIDSFLSAGDIRKTSENQMYINCLDQPNYFFDFFQKNAAVVMRNIL